MAQEIKLDSELWEQFEQAARKQRRNPARLLARLVREYLEIYEDRMLDEEIRRDARQSGYREEDAVELVRQVRQEMSQRRAASTDQYRRERRGQRAAS